MARSCRSSPRCNQVIARSAFASAPDFEAPADANGDNIYEVTVQASDGAGGIDTQAITVTVANVAGISPPPSNTSTSFTAPRCA